MPRPWNLAPGTGEHPSASPHPRCPGSPRSSSPLFPRGPSPPGVPGGPGAGSEEAAGPRSSWVQGRAGGASATGERTPPSSGRAAQREKRPATGRGVGGTGGRGGTLG